MDGDISTWWQSPTISRGLKYNRVTLSIDLVQVNSITLARKNIYLHQRKDLWLISFEDLVYIYFQPVDVEKLSIRFKKMANSSLN